MENKKCKHCNKQISQYDREHYCPVTRETYNTSTDDGFLDSFIIGAVTDSALLGGLLGGNMAGGLLGDMLDGNLFD